MKKTILYDKHCQLNARMSPFGGYLMPIQYEGIIKEHNAARTQAVIFDTCHMGEFLISGKTAVSDLEKIVTCPVGSIKIGQCRYGLICNNEGGVKDDQILYRINENEFMMVVNASTEPSDFQWIKSHISEDTLFENTSERTGKLDLQGPASPGIFKKLIKEPIDDLKYYHFKYATYRNEKVLVSRTGYTGEMGFEIYCTNDLALKFWDDCLEAGVLPAGLGARDTLRLEMGYPLYGHELDESTNASMSGFTKAIFPKTFIGSSNVLDPEKKTHILAGIILSGRRTARSGDQILDMDNQAAGKVTSGSFSPSLQCGLALGYVKMGLQLPGSKVIIRTERGDLEGTVAELPFYKNATCREDIKKFLS